MEESTEKKVYLGYGFQLTPPDKAKIILTYNLQPITAVSGKLKSFIEANYHADYLHVKGVLFPNKDISWTTDPQIKNHNQLMKAENRSSNEDVGHLEILLEPIKSPWISVSANTKSDLDSLVRFVGNHTNTNEFRLRANIRIPGTEKANLYDYDRVFEGNISDYKYTT
jgi:hypothetical protein